MSRNFKCHKRRSPLALGATLLATLSFVAISLVGCGGKKEETIQQAPELGPKWGFIDHSGKFVIRPQFRRVLPFSDGLAAADLSARWGFIDTTGKFVIERNYEDVLPFHRGFAPVKVFGGKWGAIDKNNNMVIPAKFEQIGECGQASRPMDPQDLVYCSYRDGKKWGYIDLAGETKVPPAYDNVMPFSEGFAAVAQLGKWGFVDNTGKPITDLKFDQVKSFQDRVAEGYFGADFVIIGDIGTISMSDPLHSRSFFHDDLGLSLRKGKYGFMNKAGKTVIRRRFTYAEDFSEGLAVVGVANARRGFIDTKGNLVIPPVFDEAQSFSEKFAAVRIDPRLVADDGSISASAVEEANKFDPHATLTVTAATTATTAEEKSAEEKEKEEKDKEEKGTVPGKDSGSEKSSETGSKEEPKAESGAGKETSKESTKESTKEAPKETSKDSSKDAAKETSKEASKEPGKDAAKAPAKETSK